MAFDFYKFIEMLTDRHCLVLRDFFENYLVLVQSVLLLYLRRTQLDLSRFRYFLKSIRFNLAFDGITKKNWFVFPIGF